MPTGEKRKGAALAIESCEFYSAELSSPAGEPRFVASDLAPIAWSGDGELIYARLPLGAPEIFVVSAKTGEVRPLLKLSEGIVRAGDITPDGRSLVLEALRFSGDAWLVEDFDPRVKRSAAR
jgi:hypothetical protein